MTVTLLSSSGSTSSGKKRVVYMPSAFHPDAIRYAQKKFELYQPGDADEDEILTRCEGLLMRVGALPRSLLLRCPNLRCISRNGTGVDSIDRETCLERGIVVTNNPGGNAQAVAELVVALTLNLLRRIKEMDARLRRGETIGSIYAMAPGLYGKTVGLVGMGDIATEVGRVLHYGFACKIIVFSPTSPATRWTAQSPTKDEVIIPHTRVSTLHDLLPLVDILSLHCPLTPSTANLISTPEFSLMNPSSIIINTARGGIVDESALYTALITKSISGAGIDVWAQEPPPIEKYGKLWEMDNVVAVPHLGGSTEEVTRDGCMLAVDILGEYLETGVARNRVW